MTPEELQHKKNIVYLAMLDERLQKNPNDFDALLKKGIMICEPFHQYEKSEEILNSLIKRDPLNIKAYFWQAECLGYTGDCDKIKRILEAGLLIDPKSAECHFLLADALGYFDKNYPLIEFHYKKAIELQPTWPAPRHFLAYSLEEQGKLEQAKQVLENALICLPKEIPNPEDPIEKAYEMFITGRCGRDIKKEFTDWLKEVETTIAKKTLG